MSEWPEGWFREPQGGSRSPGDPGQADSPTVRVPAGPAARGGAPARPAAGGGWPTQPPPHRVASSGGAAGRAPGTAAPGTAAAGTAAAGAAAAAGGSHGSRNGTGRRGLRPRRVFAIIGIVIALLLVAIVGTYFYFNGKLDRKNVLVDYAGPPPPPGRTG